MARPPDQRLASRATAMMESAERALRAIEEADLAVSAAGPNHGQLAARPARLVNDAEAAVFEYARQILIVEDLVPAASGSGSTPSPLRASMRAAHGSLSAAMKSLRHRADGASRGSSDASAGDSSSSEAPDRWLEPARSDVAVVLREAKAAIEASRSAVK